MQKNNTQKDIRDKILNGLNKEQQAVINETQDTSALVSSGPGSGKTHLLVARTLFLLNSGVEPKDICIVTFTNKAAKSLIERLKPLVSDYTLKQLTVGTFHKICLNILKNYGSAIKLERFTTLDEDDATKIIKDFVKKYVIEVTNEYTVDFFKFQISKLKNKIISPKKYLKSIVIGSEKEEEQKLIYMVYNGYKQFCWNKKLIDFDDMLYYSFMILNKYDNLRNKIAYRYISVDEAQDSNYIQIRITDLLTKYNRIYVGDINQSIYAWRGAIPDYFVNYKGKIMHLNQNYRSTGTIVNASDEVIKNNTKRIETKCFTENTLGGKIDICDFVSSEKEARYISNCIFNEINKKVEPKEIAILYRVNKQSIIMENSLRMLKIPYTVIGGISFFQRKEIKDVIAYMKFQINKKDSISLERILGHAEGVGKVTIDKLKKQAEESKKHLFTILKELPDTPKINSCIKKCLKELQDLSKIKTLPSDFIRYILMCTHYGKKLGDSRIEENARRIENIFQFVEFAKEYEEKNLNADIEDFVLSLNLEDIDAEENTNTVKLMSLHSSKGLEFEHVYLIGCNEGIIPHGLTVKESEDGMEEERRLFYVGITRAKKYLTITYPNYMMKPYSNKMEPIKSSRFLDEINKEYVNEITPKMY